MDHKIQRATQAPLPAEAAPADVGEWIRWRLAWFEALEARAGLGLPDSPVSWPPKEHKAPTPTYRQAYARCVAGLSLSSLAAWHGSTPARLMAAFAAMGFEVDPDVVALPYLGGWAQSAQWKRFRSELWEAREHICGQCGRSLAMKHAQLHHIDADARHNEDDNLVFLCYHCHGKTIWPGTDFPYLDQQRGKVPGPGGETGAAAAPMGPSTP